MSYTRKHILERIQQVNEIFIAQQKLGVSNENIYRLYIAHQFGISRSTFYNYLAIPYKAQIKQLNEGNQQLEMRFI